MRRGASKIARNRPENEAQKQACEIHARLEGRVRHHTPTNKSRTGAGRLVGRRRRRLVRLWPPLTHQNLPGSNCREKGEKRKKKKRGRRRGVRSSLEASVEREITRGSSREKAERSREKAEPRSLERGRLF
ncbi:hypothetical protein CJ030_MR3G018982 [Morella rubra]|uniref:Uncharacterized protein n=1 Tax=Morella rubra TaxID=262757 RepID=A0A6A1W803_9ROSI|nr:hypothetical protein CJ030_MR3G018982 [Morella rubra]